MKNIKFLLIAFFGFFYLFSYSQEEKRYIKLEENKRFFVRKDSCGNILNIYLSLDNGRQLQYRSKDYGLTPNDKFHIKKTNIKNFANIDSIYFLNDKRWIYLETPKYFFVREPDSIESYNRDYYVIYSSIRAVVEW